MKKLLIKSFAAASLSALTTAAAGHLSSEQSACFALYTEEPQILASTIINSDWVSEEVARSIVVERLRAAGIYSSETNFFGGLRITISTADEMLIVQLEFHKKVTDPISGETGVSKTWTNRGAGRIPEPSQAFIVESLTHLTERFVAEYLQAQDDCATAVEPGQQS